MRSGGPSKGQVGGGVQDPPSMDKGSSCPGWVGGKSVDSKSCRMACLHESV